MANYNPANRSGGRHEAERAAQIAPIISHLHSLEEVLFQAIKYTDGPANASRDTIMRIYTVLKIVQLSLILKMGSQNMDPRFRLSALIAVALGFFKCGLLIYILFGDIPWLTFVLCVVMPFTFIAN